MSSVAFDTLKYVEKLRSAGVPEGQAKAMVEAQAAALSESLDTTLATKADVVRIEAELKLMKWMLGATFTGVLGLLMLMLRALIHMPG